MKQVLVILRGLPASGKSTIAKKLRNFSERIVWLKVDSFKDFFGEGTDEQLEAANEAALSSLKYLLSKNYSVVMDGVFQDLSYIDRAGKIAGEMGLSFKIFELEISLEGAKQRDKSRDGIKEGFREPIADEVLNHILERVSSKDYSGVIKIDTENNSLEECIRIVRNHLND